MKASYFEKKENILSSLKLKCYKCEKYPTELVIVENPNHSLINWIFKGETIHNRYCWDCLPKRKK